MSAPRWTILACALFFVAQARADLNSAKGEPKPEKRAELALNNASDALKAAVAAYQTKGDLKQADLDLREVSDSVELAYAALAGTGKNPSRSPKHFKRAEIRTRELLRRLTDFREQMSVDDRAEADRVRASIQKVHDELLEGIMRGRKH